MSKPSLGRPKIVIMVSLMTCPQESYQNQIADADKNNNCGAGNRAAGNSSVIEKNTSLAENFIFECIITGNRDTFNMTMLGRKYILRISSYAAPAI